MTRSRYLRTNKVQIMGILNTSPESFYKKSIRTSRQEISHAARIMEKQGADVIDIGGMSTAPYLSTMISSDAESRRVCMAVQEIRKVSNIPISVDTCRAAVACDALDAGADIINDVTGLKYDKKMAQVIARYDASVVICAYGRRSVSGDASETAMLLRQGVSVATRAGISKDKITLDPAIGFFRKTGKGQLFSRTKSDWVRRDLEILANISRIKSQYPVLVSVSNKSFLGKILGKTDPADRLSASLACEALAVMNGADIIRTHNVAESRRVIDVARRLSTHKSL